MAQELDVRNDLGWLLLFISVGEQGLCLSRELILWGSAQHRGSLSTGLHWREECFVAYDRIMAEYFVHAVICIAHLCTGHKRALFIRDICESITAVKTDGH